VHRGDASSFVECAISTPQEQENKSNNNSIQFNSLLFMNNNNNNGKAIPLTGCRGP
jgi:hypothetical protein